MLWGGWYYFLMQAIVLLMTKLVSFLTHTNRDFNPIYWHPRLLFDLNIKAGGYGLEDGLFIFLVGALATLSYEFIFRKRIKYKYKHKHHLAAIGASLLLYITLLFFITNPIYPLIASTFFGAFVIWFKRHDLIKHSMVGGFVFLTTYFAIFFIMNLIFPEFVKETWDLSINSGVLISGIPLEELLWALSLGFFWSPIYEYEHGTKVAK